MFQIFPLSSSSPHSSTLPNVGALTRPIPIANLALPSEICQSVSFWRLLGFRNDRIVSSVDLENLCLEADHPPYQRLELSIHRVATPDLVAFIWYLTVCTGASAVRHPWHP